MKKHRWLESKKAIWILILLGVILAASLVLGLKKAPAEAKKDFIEIRTEYCTLYYPSRWEQNIRVLQEENTLRFRAQTEGSGLHPLFDIHFGSDEGEFFCLIGAEDGTTVSVSQTTHPLDPEGKLSPEELETLRAMQAELAVLLSKLPAAQPETAETQTEPPASSEPPAQQFEYADGDIEITTPYGKLHYPPVWKDNLHLNVTEGEVYTVEFYANVGNHPQQHLFDVQIGPLSDGEIELYTVNGQTVSLSIRFALGTVDPSWSQADADILYGMMDDVTYLLNTLPTTAPNP